MILPLLTIPYIARVIGAEGIGIYSYTYSIVNYFLLVAMLGINNYGNRSIARARDNCKKKNEIFSSIYTLQILTSCIAIVLYSAYLFLLVENFRLIATIQLVYLLSAIFDINWLFFGLEEFRVTVSSKVLIKIITVICIFLFVKNESDLWIYTLIMSISFFAGQCFLWFFVRRHIRFVRVSFKSVLVHIKPICILFFPVMATSIYRVMDKIMLGTLSSMTQVGLYENAEKIIMVSLGVISALGMVMLPRMSNLAANGRIEESKKYLIKSMQMAMFMGCAITFGIVSVANEFTPIFFGKQFTGCYRIMIGLAPTVLFIAWANVIRTQYLIPNAKDKIYIISVCLGATLNVVVNGLLIPSMGAMGAVVGTIITEVAVATYQTMKVRKELDVGIYIRNSSIFFISGVVMFVIVRCIATIMSVSILALIIEIVAGALIYLSITMAYFIRTENEMFLDIKLKISLKLKMYAGQARFDDKVNG